MVVTECTSFSCDYRMVGDYLKFIAKITYDILCRVTVNRTSTDTNT